MSPIVRNAQHHVKLPRIVLHTETGLVSIHKAGEGLAFPAASNLALIGGNHELVPDRIYGIRPKCRG
jgi:hypothetical protein